MKFTDNHLQSCSLPTAITKGRDLFEKGAVDGVHSYGSTVVAGVKDGADFRVVITLPDAAGVFQYECTCNFSHGGACEHVVAVMSAVNARDVLQTTLFSELDSAGQSPSLQDTPDSESFHADEEQLVGENTTAFYDDPPRDSIVSTITPKPTGRIYLSERGEDLVVELRCAYPTGIQNREWIEFKRDDSAVNRYIPGINNSVVCIQRSKAREHSLFMELYEHKLMAYQRGVFVPSIDKREWVSDVLPELDERGYEIYGHKKLISSTIRYNKPRLGLTVQSNDGSFTCTLNADFGGIPASLAALIHAVRSESLYVRLNDGSSGILPRAWQKVLDKILSVVKVDPGRDHFTCGHYHLPLLDMLYDIAESRETDEIFEIKRSQLKHFDGIKAKPDPEFFNCTMRPYQKAGFEWFYFLQEFHFGGCLADDMGLGKTIQSLALLQNEKNEKRSPKTSIVVVPTSLLFNWEREARVFAPTLLVAVYYGSTRKRIATALENADLVLTTYGTLLRDSEFLGKMTFNYIILDEAQTIKNPSSHILKAVHKLHGYNKLALSGTPIENSLVELWSLFSFLNPGMFGALSSFRKNIVKPVEVDSDTTSLTIIKRIIFPFVLRRTKQQVAKDLPAKTETVVYTEMLPRQRHLYDCTREAYLGKIMDTVNSQGIEHSGIQIIEGMLRLRQICCHPVLVDQSFAGESGKFVLFDEYMENILSEGHRVLVFSQFESVLNLLRGRLAQKRVPYEYLTGKTHDRQKVVTNFRESSIPVFLISLKAGGVGLNLVEADYVIHMDPWWNPATENQATDRVHRIGQTREVFVYKFIVANSIEERVLRMQSIKKMLSGSIIQTEQSFFKQLTKQEIVSLFS